MRHCYALFTEDIHLNVDEGAIESCRDKQLLDRPLRRAVYLFTACYYVWD